MANYYLLIKSLHLISVISWMAAMLYLPRLFVYHVGAVQGGELDNTLKIMEKRLYYIIATPAMILSIISGILLIAVLGGGGSLGGWFHAKAVLLISMFLMHKFLGRCRKQFANGKNGHSAKFYRIINEIPTIIMIIIVILAVMKPF